MSDTDKPKQPPDDGYRWVRAPKNSTFTLFGVEVEKKISITVLGYIGVTCVTFMWLTFGYLVKIDAQSADIAKFKEDITRQIKDMRSDMLDRMLNQQKTQSDQFTAIQNSIQALPDVRATLQQMERRQDETDRRSAAQSARLDQVQQTGMQNSADIVGMLRALTGAPRGGGH